MNKTQMMFRNDYKELWGEVKEYNDQISVAKDIISTFIGDKVNEINFELIEKNDEKDVINFSIKNEMINIKGSSTIALCYGFYSLSKKMKWGMIDWENHSIVIPAKYDDLEDQEIKTPYKKHYFFNPVSHGYSAPYWDFAEWEYRMKWFAMHGYDMILTPVAFEAIYARSLNTLGIDPMYIRDYFTGPAYLPWCRFGNISNWNKNPFFEEWCEKQIKLQHNIQKYAYAMGMEIIPQAFSGFVPKHIKSVKGFENANLTETKWGTYEGSGNFFINPHEKEFSRIGSLFIEEYEKEFGKQKYYIADSFVEMEIPIGDATTEEEITEKRCDIINKTSHGLSKMIHDVNPDATWVLTGWMIGYQRWIWNKRTWGALIDGLVDKDKFIIIDAAEDYNHSFWHNGTNWEHFEGFDADWIYSTIPNMGGNQGYTGPLEWYAKAGPDALNSKYSDRLIGYGTSPEGLESNPVTYELLADMGWRSADMPFDEWIENYTFNRYKFFNDEIKKYWDLRVNSINQHLDDHPIYAFQTKPGKTFGRPQTRAMSGWKDAIEQFIKVANNMDEKDMTDLFKADLYRMGALYIGMQIDDFYATLPTYLGKKEVKKATEVRNTIDEYYDYMDKILASHRVDTLRDWIEWAKVWGDNEFERNYYEMDSKKLITTWMFGLEDYAARIWHGLLGIYYKPRMMKHIDNMIDPSKPEWNAMDDERWHHKPLKDEDFSKPFANPVKDAIKVLNEAVENRKTMLPTEDLGSFASIDFPKNAIERSARLPISAKDLQNVNSVTFVLHNRGEYDSQVLINGIHFVADGKNVIVMRWDDNPLLINSDKELVLDVKRPDGMINANNESYISASLGSKGNESARFIIEVKIN